MIQLGQTPTYSDHMAGRGPAPTKTYELSLVKDYVSHWGVKEAVRELIQNALDSASPFVYEWLRAEGEPITLRLNSEFSSLSPQTLLLGATSKAEDKDAIGSFGEGYKIALLVLTRMGYEVGILNGDKLWKPRFRFNRNFGCEVLVIDETQLPNKVNNGLTFQVEGLTDDDQVAITASCIRMQDHIGAIKQTVYGDILLERPGELYVGGLFICETELEFGYNVKPEHIRLERDRRTVDGWDLKILTRDMWFETRDYDRIADLVGQECPDLAYVKYGAPDIVREACYQHFRRAHPGAVIAETQAQLEQLVKEKFTVYVGGPAYYSAVSSAPSYRAENHNLHRVKQPLQTLEDWLRANRKAMRGSAIESFKKELLETEAPKWRVAG